MLNIIPQKPPIKYTDMAIYIDNHIYTNDCDQDTVFIYLYHLAFMLAHKGKIFRRKEYYADFAFFFAERIYRRLKDPRQFLPEEDEKKLSQVNSVLNYMKASLYGMKVDFEQQTYSQGHSLNPYASADYNNSEYRIVNQIRYYTDSFNTVEAELCLKDIHKIIKFCIANSPYINNQREWHNIYISCLLTILNSFILSPQDKATINEIKENTLHWEGYKLTAIDKIYNNKNNKGAILYHLDETMADYIQILVKKIKSYLNDMLGFNTFLLDEKNLLATTIEELQGESSNLVIYES